ncbi:MAG: four-carbon acid sugar kinase family protein [Acidobacteriaceae bacterium]
MYYFESKWSLSAIHLSSATPNHSEAALPAPRPDRIWLLADDLTGGCDAGAAFLRAGLRVRVWAGAQASFAAPETVQAVNTASRALPPDEAARAVSSAAAAFRGGDRTLFFKKIDSALRGPIAAELNAAHQGLRTRAILLAPAFPAARRTVRHGILEVEDVSGRRETKRIRDLFPRSMEDSVAQLAGADELAPALERGKTVLICDGMTQEDLDRLARAAQPLRGLLYAGSAGLAQAIAGPYATRVPPSRIPGATRTLVVCGTSHPVTELQLKDLDHKRFVAVEVLRIRCENGDENRIRAAFEAVHPQAMVLTGGDTALLALRALGVHSLVLRGECTPGIPWGSAEGGTADGSTIVTKSGGFGAVSALNEVLEMLTGRA